MEDYIKDVIKLTNLNQNKPLNEIVYEGLRTAIIRGIIPVGDRIKEIEYAERMNISRTPIRDAIKRIQDEGLLEYVPHYGVIVKRISAADAEEIFKIRVALESLAFINAMEIMTEEEFKSIYHLLELTDEANTRQDVAAVTQYFTDFNDMIYRYARMPRLETIVSAMRQYLVRFRDISMSGDDRRRKALNEHWMIYQSMKDKKSEEIPKLIEEHLMYAKKFIIEEIIKAEKAANERINQEVKNE